MDQAFQFIANNESCCGDMVEILKAIAHPVRLNIIALLCEGEESVGQIAERLDVNQAIVSQQLRILRMSGLVAATRTRGHSYYRLTNLHLRDLLKCMVRCYTSARDSLPVQG